MAVCVANVFDLCDNSVDIVRGGDTAWFCEVNNLRANLVEVLPAFAKIAGTTQHNLLFTGSDVH
jgi:hypothetical protein